MRNFILSIMTVAIVWLSPDEGYGAKYSSIECINKYDVCLRTCEKFMRLRSDLKACGRRCQTREENCQKCGSFTLAGCPSASTFERPPRNPGPAPKPNVGPAGMDGGLLERGPGLPAQGPSSTGKPAGGGTIR